jgi:hypothetical protein
MRHLSRAGKMVGIPHLRGESRLFQSIFPYFLHFPTESFIAPIADLSALGGFPAIQMKQ